MRSSATACAAPPNEIPNNIQSVDPEDLILLESGGKAPALKPPGLSIFIADTVMNNNDTSLKKSGASGDREISIGVDPKNTNRVVISDVSGGPDATVLLWLSTDGGTTWIKELTTNSPRASSVLGCPCDQTAEFAQFYSLTGAISKIAGSVGAYDNFNLQGFIPPVSQLAGLDIKEQPWLLTGRSTSAAGVSESVSVAHGDFSTVLPQRVAVPAGIDRRRVTNGIHRTGASVGVVNLGYRLASDPRSGALYSLFQRWRNAGGGDSQNINYMLNRSTDGGRTWELNGSPEGIVVAKADSTQPLPKFCTVNATLGGADQAVVDPQTGDVFYVYGKRYPETGNTRLAVRRLSDDKHGGLAIEREVFVTGQVQATIPAVAITSNDTLGVFYYVCDGTRRSPDFRSSRLISASAQTKAIVSSTTRLQLSCRRPRTTATQDNRCSATTCRRKQWATSSLVFSSGTASHLGRASQARTRSSIRCRSGDRLVSRSKRRPPLPGRGSVRMLPRVHFIAAVVGLRCDKR